MQISPNSPVSATGATALPTKAPSGCISRWSKTLTAIPSYSPEMWEKTRRRRKHDEQQHDFGVHVKRTSARPLKLCEGSAINERGEICMTSFHKRAHPTFRPRSK